jgi:ferredoxin
LKVMIDLMKCTSAGQCVLAAPEVFDQRDEDGLVILLNPSPPDELAESVEEAAALCPALAIRVER